MWQSEVCGRVRCGAGRESSLAEGKLNLLLTALTAVHLPTRPAVVLRGGVREIEETGSEGEKGRGYLPRKQGEGSGTLHTLCDVFAVDPRALLQLLLLQLVSVLP